MAATMYAVEGITWSLLTALYCVLFGAILLSMRFTPRKKVPDAKLQMVILAVISIILNIARSFDLSSVYGLCSYRAMNWLHNLVTVLHLYCVTLFIRSIARTLYMQMQQKAPSFYTWALLSANTIYFLSVMILNPIQISAGQNYDRARGLYGYKGFFFDVDVAILMVTEIVLYIRLRSRLLNFISTVEVQHRGIANTAVTTGGKSLMTRQASIDVTATASAKQGPTSPPTEDGVSNTTATTAGDDVLVRVASPAPDTSSDPNKNLLSVDGQHERRSSESASLQPVSDAPPSPQAPPVKVNIVAVAPTPALVPPNRTLSHVRSGSSATVAPAPQVQTVTNSSHDTRVQELRTAVRTLSILNAVCVVIAVGCIAFDLPGSLRAMFNFGSQPTPVDLFGPDPNDYKATGNAMPFVQQLNLAVMAWYCGGPWVFLAKYRKEKNIGFWDGLLHGVDGSGLLTKGSRYEGAGQSRIDTKGNSKLQRSNTQQQRERAPSSGQLPPVASPETEIAPLATANSTQKQAWTASSPEPVVEEDDE